MANVLLLRTESSEQGTFGILVFNDEYLHTAELPWKGNKPNISCIPEGTYQVSMRVSPKYGQCFIVAVEGRSYILFHNGELGLETNLWAYAVIRTDVSSSDKNVVAYISNKLCLRLVQRVQSSSLKWTLNPLN